MAKASKYFGGGGGGTALGGTTMLITDQNDVTLEGIRYLRSGFVEDNTAGLDPSVINDGVHYVPFGNPITIGDRMKEFAVSDDGQTIIYTHLDGGQRAVRSADGGLTWANVDILSSGYTIEGIATDGQGNWLATGYDSNVASQTMSSIDDGATWQTVTMPSPPTTPRSQGCWYSKETGDWLVSYESNSATGTDGAMYYNTTNVTGGWTKAPVNSVGISTTSQAVKVLPPRDGNATWFCSYRSGTNNYYISMSKDGGANWVRIAQDGITWPHEEFNAGMYTVAAKPNSLFAISDAAEPGSDQDILIVELDIQVGVNVNSAVLANRYYKRTLGGNNVGGYYEFLENGFSPEAYRNYKGTAYTNNGWATTDGISFRQVYQFEDSHAGTAMLFYIPDDTHWWYYSSQVDDNSRQRFENMVPVAGVAIGYNEGASAQFVRIE